MFERRRTCLGTCVFWLEVAAELPFYEEKPHAKTLYSQRPLRWLTDRLSYLVRALAVAFDYTGLVMIFRRLETLERFLEEMSTSAAEAFLC